MNQRKMHDSAGHAGVERLVSVCRDSMGELEDIVDAAKPGLDAGLTLGEMRGLSGDHYDAMYDAVCSLCSEERYEDALPLALQMAAHDPTSHQYAFAAAGCFQQMGRADLAVPLYGLSLLASETPVAMYRLGECYAKLGNKDKALECFGMVPTLCEGDPHCTELQDWAAEASKALNGAHS